MTDSVRKYLKEMNLDSMIIQVGAQNIFKHLICVEISHLKQRWSNYFMINGLVKVSINLLKVEIWSPLPGKKKIEWVLDAWSQLSKENIVKLFKCCGLDLANDVMEDNFIHCLKKGQPCKAGRQKLNFQLSILVDKSDAMNPFISPSNEDDVNEEMNVIKHETDREIII